MDWSNCRYGRTFSCFLLALFLASKVEGKRIEDYGVSVRGKDWGYLAGGLVVGIGVFLLITSPLYLTGRIG